ncbi:Protein SGT1 homolog [Coccomyxa sp. Obi]|nr:Protein SGT1 homolog [Coccomyxa sp. Obi]
MAEQLVQQAHAAYVDEEFVTAIDLYTKAIAISPNDADLYASRAQSYIKEERFLEAVQDASKAAELSPELAKAHLRKGVAFFYLEEYESAKEAFETANSLQKKKETETWISKCNAELEEEARRAKQSSISQEVATTDVPSHSSCPAPNCTPAPSSTNGHANDTQQEDLTKPISKAAADTQTGKYRYQFFQTPKIVEVDVLAKNLTPDRFHMDIDERKLHVVVKSPEGEQEYELNVDLYDAVVPSESKFELLKTKVEIQLKKASPVAWPTLEKSEKKIAANFSDLSKEHPPSYPSSFTKGRKMNWDKLEHEVKLEEKDEKLEGEQALQKLFRDIYSGADEDTRRAMNKSFQESGGTVLSTNWKEVGAKKIECSPPTGMEKRTFEY